MRPLTLAVALSAIAIATPATAAVFAFKATLNGASEDTPNDSPGSGWARVSFDDDLLTMRVQSSFEDLVAPSTAAHIHAPTAVAGTGTASVATQTPSFSGFPLGVTSGVMDNTFSMTFASSYSAGFLAANGDSTADAGEALLESLLAGTAYFNIHSTAFPGGEIRGFLAQVPEPQAWALMILGFGAAGAALRSRRPTVARRS